MLAWKVHEPGPIATGPLRRVDRAQPSAGPGELLGWLRGTCGVCSYRRRAAENLCPQSTYTGWDADGGYAEYCVVPADFAVAGIHLSDIPVLRYQEHLFYERNLCSVTADTREDGRAFFARAALHPLQVTVTEYPCQLPTARWPTWSPIASPVPRYWYPTNPPGCDLRPRGRGWRDLGRRL